jgi:hypothetical protein
LLPFGGFRREDLDFLRIIRETILNSDDSFIDRRGDGIALFEKGDLVREGDIGEMILDRIGD